MPGSSGSAAIDAMMTRSASFPPTPARERVHEHALKNALFNIRDGLSLSKPSLTNRCQASSSCRASAVTPKIYTTPNPPPKPQRQYLHVRRENLLHDGVAELSNLREIR